MPAGSLVDGFEPARLVARWNYFTRDASTIVKLTLAEQALFAGIIGLLLVGLLVAISRLSGHRTPLVLFSLAAIFGICERVIDIFWFIRQYDEWPPVNPYKLARLAIGWHVTVWLCDIAFGLGVLAIIIDRAAVAGISRKGRFIAGTAVAGFTVLPLLILLIVRNAKAAAAVSAYQAGKIRTYAYRLRLYKIEKLRYGFQALYGAMALGLLALSIIVYVKILRRSMQGKRPAKVVSYMIAPILILYLIWRCIFAFANLDEGDFNSFNSDIKYFVDSLGRGLVYIFLLIVVTVMGFNRGWWDTEGKTWPQVTPHAQGPWVYYAPVQQPQMQTPQLGVGSPGMMLQPAQAYTQPSTPQPYAHSQP